LEEVEAEIASEAITDEKEPLMMNAYCFQDHEERQGHSERLAYQERSFYGLRPQHLRGAAVLMHVLLYVITLTMQLYKLFIWDSALPEIES
jgi:hypothetical protein